MISEDLKKAVVIFAKNYSDDEQKITSAIVEGGFSLSDAERVTAFSPLAFARVALGRKFNVKFSNSFRVKDSDQVGVLEDEPIYKLSLIIAKDALDNESLDPDVFNCLARHSSEFGALNKALNDGADVVGAKFGDPIFFGFKTLIKKKGFFGGLFS
jgi:hypothetical protein